MAAKKTTKKSAKNTARVRSTRSGRSKGSSQGGGGKDAASVETTPYPSVGDNPEFSQFVRGELDCEASQSRGDVPDQDESQPKPALGRPPGTGKHQKAAKALNEFQAAGIDETIMASVFKGAFQALAFTLGEPKINLSGQEAEAFARPACVLWGYYMPEAVSPVQAAWSQLAMVAVGVIGARTDALSRGWKKRRDAKETPAPKPAAATPAPAVVKSEIPTPGKVKFTPAKGGGK